MAIPKVFSSRQGVAISIFSIIGLTLFLLQQQWWAAFWLFVSSALALIASAQDDLIQAQTDTLEQALEVIDTQKKIMLTQSKRINVLMRLLFKQSKQYKLPPIGRKKWASS